VQDPGRRKSAWTSCAAAPRGVTLTAEGKTLFSGKGSGARSCKAAEGGAVEKKSARLARGEYGELHLGYAPSPTVEILPPALAAFSKKPCPA